MDTGNPLAARLAVLLLAYLPEDLTSAPPSIPCPAETWPMRIACDHNVTQVVIGQTARGHLDSLLRGSVINQILREARNVDVHVVADRSTSVTDHLSHWTPAHRRHRHSPVVTRYNFGATRCAVPTVYLGTLGTGPPRKGGW